MRFVNTQPALNSDMFFVGEVVKPSGKGRTATWDGMVGTVVRVDGTSIFVQWHNVAVEDELDIGGSGLGTFQKRVPHHALVLDISDGGESVHVLRGRLGEAEGRSEFHHLTDTTPSSWTDVSYIGV